MNCPDCGTEMLAVEYAYGDPLRYDGISEWLCPVDGTRIGRWSKRRLRVSEGEDPRERFRRREEEQVGDDDGGA